MSRIDCSNLNSEMKRKGISPHELACLLGERDETIRAKIEGTSEWIYREAVTIRDVLFPECELGYLFREKEQDE